MQIKITESLVQSFSQSTEKQLKDLGITKDEVTSITEDTFIRALDLLTILGEYPIVLCINGIVILKCLK